MEPEREIVTPEVFGKDEPETSSHTHSGAGEAPPKPRATGSRIKNAWSMGASLLNRVTTRPGREAQEHGGWWRRIKDFVIGGVAVDIASIACMVLPWRIFAFAIGAAVAGWFCWRNRVEIKRCGWPVVMSGIYCGLRFNGLFLFLNLIPVATLTVIGYQIRKRYTSSDKGK